jgi:hypothetical protein
MSGPSCFIANCDVFAHDIASIVSIAGLQDIGEFAGEKWFWYIFRQNGKASVPDQHAGAHVVVSFNEEDFFDLYCRNAAWHAHLDFAGNCANQQRRPERHTGGATG